MPSMDNIVRRLSQSFDQVKQLASEKMGVPVAITDFPLAYNQLDERVDQIKDLFDGFVRCAKQLRDAHAYEPPLMDSFKNNIERLHDTIKKTDDALASTATGESKAIYSEMAKLGAETSAFIADSLNSSNDQQLSDLLMRFSKANETMAQAAIMEMNAINDDFLVPFMIFEQSFDVVNKCRRNALSARRDLDSAKSKSVDNANQAQLAAEISQLEQRFTEVCDDAIHEMRNFAQHVTILQGFENLVSVQLAYHKRCMESLMSIHAAKN